MKTIFSAMSPGRIFKSVFVQARVVRALMLRQALSRFGHDSLGIFWIFAEPLILSGAVMVMWTLTGLHKAQQIGVVPFVLASYSMLTLWRHMCSMSIRALSSVSPLLYHRNIRLLDVLIARAALESFSGVAAFTVAYFVLYLFDFIRDVHDPLVMTGAWILMTWFGWSFALIVAALTELVEPVEHLIQPLLYVTLPLTGAFYMVSWLPVSAQHAVMWSPLVHIMEMFRGGLFGVHLAAEWSVLYVAGWCIAFMAIGMPLLAIAQRRFTAQ